MDGLVTQPKLGADTGFDSARVAAAVDALAEKHVGHEDVFRSSVAQYLKTQLIAARAAAQALLLSEILFGLDLPQGLSVEMRRARAVRWLVAVALEEMSDPDAMSHTIEEPLGGLKVQLSHFLLAPGLRHWLQELRTKSIGWHDFQMLELPRPLYFLYPLLRMPSWWLRWAGSLLRKRQVPR